MYFIQGIDQITDSNIIFANTSRKIAYILNLENSK
jgi:hypothetical protein